MIEAQSSRKPAVAGLFYPAEKNELNQTIEKLFTKTANFIENIHNKEHEIKAIIAPHAGYVYSGECATFGYLQIPKDTKLVYLLGPSHHVGFSGIALPSVKYFSTPLGDIQLNQEIIDDLVDKFEHIKFFDQAHQYEHSLEVHLPFLQKYLANFKIVPMVVGQCSKHELVKTIEFLDNQNYDSSIFLISSDLSHFHTYENAKQIDDQTINRILNFDTNIVGEEACGCYPLNGWLLYAKHNQLMPKLIKKYNSGDVFEYGDKSRVVGYASFAFYKQAK